MTLEESACQDSGNICKTLLHASISLIIYIRCLLSENHFSSLSVGKLLVKVLRDDTCEAGSLINAMLKRGVYTAIDKKYLKKLTFAIIHSPDQRDQSLESYHFNFSYNKSRKSTKLKTNVTLLDQQNTAHQLADMTIKSRSSLAPLNNQMHQFLRTLVLAIQTLKHLPSKCYVDMHLQYTADTPANYEPEFFLHSTIIPVVVPLVKYSVNIQGIRTESHCLDLELETSIGPLVYDQDKDAGSSRASTLPLEHAMTMEECFDTELSTCISESDLSSVPILHKKQQKSKHRRAARPSAPSPDMTQDSSDSSKASTLITRNRAKKATPHIYQIKVKEFTPISPPQSQEQDFSLVSSPTEEVGHRISATSSLASPIPESDQVKCACGINDPDCGMMQCSTCLNWQHVVCFGFFHIRDTRLPDEFMCHVCNPKFKSHVLPGLREIALYRSIISIIWTEEPTQSGKTRSRSHSASQKNDTNIPLVRVWSAKQVATRLGIPLSLVQKYLARAKLDGFVKDASQARNTRRKKSDRPTVVEVLKESDDARRALIPLFDPELISLPLVKLLSSPSNSSSGATGLGNHQSLSQGDSNPSNPDSSTVENTCGGIQCSPSPVDPEISIGSPVFLKQSAKALAPSLESNTSTIPGAVHVDAPSSWFDSQSNTYNNQANWHKSKAKGCHDQTLHANNHPSSGSLAWPPASQTQPLTDTRFSNLHFTQSSDSSATGSQRLFLVEKGRGETSGSDTLSEAGVIHKIMPEPLNTQNRRRHVVPEPSSNSMKRQHSSRNPINISGSTSSTQPILNKNKKRKRINVVQTPENTMNDLNRTKFPKMSAAEAPTRIIMM